ncbi:CIC11C00000001998 [Sungouiella intermedia]|uniref:CIC11C00000001998 n=1 Tax=Sungouiella intermedia TaxID=45354 RepID=A0A1L0BKY2_9ASCO|nr:CIC11C00000001998 [[Candida] intermedia]
MTMAELLYKPKSEPQRAPVLLLTPENCRSSTRIRAFLLLSRIAADDTIRQHLNEIKPKQCDDYFARSILPQWIARQEAIQYCSDYARDLHNKTESEKVEVSGNYDLRVDPYALKDANERLVKQFSECSNIENWVANELSVESIIKEQTANVLNDKCYYKDWLADFRQALHK